ncbi:hypothetical protein G6F56_010879 [Rhizopus delemar]|nr:hypothetical protein G6F56_010879 [Rhizopus delemar]
MWLPASSILTYLSPSMNPGKGDLDRLSDDLLEDLVEAKLLLVLPPPRRVTRPEGDRERTVFQLYYDYPQKDHDLLETYHKLNK